MYITDSEYITEVRKNMRGGNGEVIIQHITKDTLPPNARLMARIILNKDCSIGYHVHENEAETFYFVSGCGTVDDNGTIKEVKAGDSLITTSGCGHSVSNTSDEPLVLFAVITLN